MNDWYSAADSPELVEFGPVRGLGVTGVGAPGGRQHLAGIQALYAVAAQLLGDRVPARIDRFMQERGLVANGLHHEIYLSDVRGDRSGEDADDSAPTSAHDLVS